jgi:acetylornithine deacetylase/succinyl-diaminopimelate desuccinylase-like protein
MNTSPALSFSKEPAALLQKLIQFDTTNPPGNERECVLFVRDLLAEVGIESQLFGKSAERPNLVARLPSQGNSPPLLLYGHVDVVTTEDQPWTHPPFEGRLVDGFIWGRGALDMKGGVAMMLAALLRAKCDGLKLPGDVVLAIVCDEEAGGDLGAKYLVENHPEQFTKIRYALGEFGGFPLTVGTQRFYPIQVAEKQICWIKAIVCGPGGHGSMPVRDGAMAKLGRFLVDLNKRRLPVHITSIANRMIETISSTIGGVGGLVLGQLLNPKLTNIVLKLLGERGRVFDPLLHNTVSPTVLNGSQKINVIPSEVSVELDGRLLPGYGPDDLLNELRQITQDIEFEVIRYDPCPGAPDMGMFDKLAGILHGADPTGVPVPWLLSGSTDARYFSRLGIQTYGFLPMQLPEDFNFINFIHAANERIPVAALDFGVNAIYQVLQQF